MEGNENVKGLGNEEELEDEVDQDDKSGTNVDDVHVDENGKNTDKKERSFTQAQVNRMMTREKKQGRAAAYKEIGVDPKNTRMIKMLQAFVKSQGADEDTGKDTEFQRRQLEAEQRACVAEAKAEAMMLGIKPQYVDDAVALAMSKMSDDTELKTVLGELKGKYTLWFEEDDRTAGDKANEHGKTGQKGTGTSVKEVGKKGKETSGMGARLAAQKKSTTKTSYWGKR